jgi:hypothetical protein
VPYKASYVLSRSQYGTISGMTHIKMSFSFSPHTGQEFHWKRILCSSFAFCTFRYKQCLLQTQKKSFRGEKSWEGRGQGPGPLLPIQRSGNSVSSKSRALREGWGDARSKWKPVSTGMCRAVFSIIAKKCQ